MATPSSHVGMWSGRPLSRPVKLSLWTRPLAAKSVAPAMERPDHSPARQSWVRMAFLERSVVAVVAVAVAADSSLAPMGSPCP